MKPLPATTVPDHTIATGIFLVSGGHSLHYELWGNPDATAIIHLHGGPGSGYSDSHKQMYDPGLHKVLFFDQRGSGRSTPLGKTANNTTPDLVADIEALRTHLKLGEVYVSGGSWGSCLALCYALKYPSHVRRLLLWGIYLGTRAENDLINTGHARQTYPEAWERFISLVPKAARGSGSATMKHYAANIRSQDAALAYRYAAEWGLWEATHMSLGYERPKLEAEAFSDDPLDQQKTIASALIETEYFLHGCYLADGHILDNIGKIQHIPASIIHGRYDLCTPPFSALALRRAYGPQATLQWVSAGHRRSDPELLAALRATANAALR